MYTVHYYKYLSVEQKNLFLQHLETGGHNGFQHCMNIQREAYRRVFLTRKDAEEFRDTALKDDEDYQCIESSTTIVNTSNSYDKMLNLISELAEKNLRIKGLE